MYVQGEDDAEPPHRGLRVSTVLTALLVALGLALPGVAVFLRSPAAQPTHDGQTRAPPEVAGPGGGETPTGAERPRAEAPDAPLGDGTRPEAGPATVARRDVQAGLSPASAPGTRTSVTAEQSLAKPPASSLVTRVDPPPAPRQRLPLLPAEVEQARAIVADARLPAERRSEAALVLLDAHWRRERWRSLARDGELIARLGLPPFEDRLPAEHACWGRLQALWHLKEWDPLMTESERFLRTYPDSRLSSAVETQMRSVTMARDTEERERRGMLQLLREAEAEAARDIVLLEERGEPTDPVRRNLDFRRCSITENKDHEQALAACRAYMTTWGPGTTLVQLNDYRDARGNVIKSLARLRRYAEARKLLAEFLADDAEGEKRTAAQSVIMGLPPDAEE